jgi:hypothetical protein
MQCDCPVSLQQQGAASALQALHNLDEVEATLLQSLAKFGAKVLKAHDGEAMQGKSLADYAEALRLSEQV